jgi:hypothetical protein
MVDVNDLLQLLSAFGGTSPPGTEDEDVTGDGAVDVNDLLQLLSVRTHSRNALLHAFRPSRILYLAPLVYLVVLLARLYLKVHVRTTR